MNTSRIRRRQLASHSAIVVGVLFAGGALLPRLAIAQDDESIEEIVVTGYKASILAAREAKRGSEAISDSIMAEDIGKSTDENIAEALSRVTGISLQTSGGIGTTVTVRGLDPNLNTVSLNGVELGSSSDGRDVDLSAYSADMLSQIEVVKTAAANHNEGSLGGAINLTTMRPLTRKQDRITGEVQWRSTDFDGEDDYKYSFGLNKKFADEKFGVAATVIQDNQFRRSDLFQTFNWRIDSYLNPVSLQTGQIISGRVYGAQPRFSVQRIDGIQRDNTTANLVLQYRPSDAVDLYLDHSWSNLDLVNDRYLHRAAAWHANNPTASNGGNPGRPLPTTAILDEDNQTFIFSNSRRIQSFLQTRHIEEERETNTTTLGGTFFEGPLTIDARASYMKLDQDLPIWNQINFQNVAASTPVDPPSGFSCGVEIDPVTNAATPGGTQVGASDMCGIVYGAWWPINDPDIGPRLAQARINGRVVNDEATSFFLDLDYEIENRFITSIAAGMKYSDRSKDRFQQDVGISRSGAEDDPGAIPIGQMSQPFPYSDGWLGDESRPGQLTSWIVPDLDVAFASLWPSGIPGTTPNAIQTWDTSEEVAAAYLMASFENESARLTGNIGVRYVNTLVNGNGTSGYTFRSVFPTYFTIDTDEDCTSVAGNVCFVEVPVSESKRYGEWLPSLNLTYLLREDMMLRFAASRTMARPSFNDIRPSGNLNIPSSGGGAAPTFSGGNTLLNPLLSDNIDLSWEWYFGDSNLLAAAVFYKDMKDFVFTTTTLRRYPNPIDPPGGFIRDESEGLVEDTDGDGIADQFPIADVISTVPVNGAAAEIFGVELTYQQNFDNLPGLLSGLGVLFNYTYADSDADYTDAEGPEDPYEGYPFINTSEHTVNGTVFWENDRVAARLAYNWRSERLISPTDLQMSTWADPIGSLDASFSIRITDNVSLTGNAVNLTDEAPRWFQTIAFVNANQPGVSPEGSLFSGSLYEDRTNQLEYYGRTYRFGVRVSFD
jgi:TonB-dependent receptor